MKQDQETDLESFDLSLLLRAAFNRCGKEVSDFNVLIEQLENEIDKNCTLELKVKALEVKLAEKPQTSLEFSGDAQKKIDGLLSELDIANGEKDAAHASAKHHKGKAKEVISTSNRLVAEVAELKKERMELKAFLEEARDNAAEHAFKHGMAVGDKHNLRNELDTLEVERDELLSASNKFNAKLAKSQKELVASKNKANSFEIELTGLKKLDAKDLKKKVDSLKKRNGELFASRELLIKDNRAYRQDQIKYKAMADTVLAYQQINKELEFKYDMAKGSTIYSKDSEHILLLPMPLRIAVDGEELPQYQVQVLYTNSAGIWVQTTLDGDGNLVTGKLLSDAYAEKTLALANKCLPKMSKEAALWTHKWLRKVKSQDWLVAEDDLYRSLNDSEEEHEPQVH